MKTKRVLGSYPIFGSELSQLNKQRVTEAQFLSGFKEQPNYKELNQMFNSITSGLNYIYDMGIPEFTNNVAYRKGAVVTFDGNIFISFVDENIKHVTQSSHWGKISIEPNGSKYSNTKPSDKVDTNPIGTILTVPKTTKLTGYIDYIEGESFSEVLYPELYKALGSNRFGESNTTNDFLNLPIGSLVHTLSDSANVPNGWLEWKPYTSIINYPELKQVLQRMAERLPVGEAKQYWINSLNSNVLPMFDMDTFYLGIGSNVGEWKPDTTKESSLVSPPIVIDNSNTLNPLGVTRCLHEEQTHYVVVNPEKQTQKSLQSDLVVTAQKADVYQNINKSANVVTIGNGTVTAPKTVLTRLLVKATQSQPTHISTTHKRVIKYV